MADFVVYDEPPEYLNVEDLININNNLIFVRFMLLNKGYEIASLKLFNPKTNTPPSDVREIINTIEKNIDTINGVYKSVFYGKLVRFEGTAPRKDDVWRWIKIINDWHSSLAESEDIDVIKCTDGYPTIGGKYIKVLPTTENNLTF